MSRKIPLVLSGAVMLAVASCNDSTSPPTGGGPLPSGLTLKLDPFITSGLNAPVATGGTPTLKSLADGVQQSIGQLVSGSPAAGSAGTVPSAPSVALPPLPTVPPVPSLPPIDH